MLLALLSPSAFSRSYRCRQWPEARAKDFEMFSNNKNDSFLEISQKIKTSIQIPPNFDLCAEGRNDWKSLALASLFSGACKRNSHFSLLL
jgi:hypothetical protein